jgi:hypothetical protein
MENQAQVSEFVTHAPIFAPMLEIELGTSQIDARSRGLSILDPRARIIVRRWIVR